MVPEFGGSRASRSGLFSIAGCHIVVQMTGQMSALSENPFAVLTAVVAPAVLTNACSVLTLSTGNRLARVVDRSRVLTAELAALSSGAPEYQILVNQLERLQLRAQMLIRAMRNFYASLGSFASTALISIIGSALALYNQSFAFHAAAALGLLAGIYGVSGLVLGCATMIRETRLAVRSITEDAELVRARFSQK